MGDEINPVQYELPRPLRFQRDWQLATADALEVEEVNSSLIDSSEPELTENEPQAYWRFALDWNKERCDALYKSEPERSLTRYEQPCHQLLGSPYVANEDGRLKAVRQSRSFPLDSNLITPDETEQMFAEAPDWQLLFQFSSDDELNWGDSGNVSCFIERSALERRDFSDVQATYDG